MSSDTIYTGRVHLTRLDGLRAFGRDLSRFVSYFLACLKVARQRRRLLALDNHALKDIGIARADAHREAARIFWDIPEDATYRG